MTPMLSSYQDMIRGVAPLGPKTRSQITEAIGIRSIPWVVTEWIGPSVLRSFEVGARSNIGVSLILKWPTQILPRVPIDAKLSLWTRLVEPPFGWLCPVAQKTFGFEAILQPLEFEKDLRNLIDIFEKLAALASQVEFLWLRLETNQPAINILIHTVRKQIIGIGTFENAKLLEVSGCSVMRLDSYFGTRSLLLPIVPASREYSAWKGFETAVLRSLSQATSAL